VSKTTPTSSPSTAPEPKQPEPKQPEATQPEPKQPEPKQPEPKQPEPKKPEVRKPDKPAPLAIPPVKGTTKEGIAYTKDFDAKWLTAQRALLLEEREALTGQATRLEDEANALIEEQEMGDVQFDDEGGEGDTMVVERERDLALSAQARQMVADIDAALERMTLGTYGYSVESGRPIPRERLEAIPWATVLVEEKVGGIGRR
jgi:RNA polymerase-binding transcription factor DksA